MLFRSEFAHAKPPWNASIGAYLGASAGPSTRMFNPGGSGADCWPPTGVWVPVAAPLAPRRMASSSLSRVSILSCIALTTAFV